MARKPPPPPIWVGKPPLHLGITRMIRVLFIAPRCLPHLLRIEGGIEPIHAIVGGSFDVARLDRHLAFYLHDEGMHQIAMHFELLGQANMNLLLQSQRQIFGPLRLSH